MSDLRELADQMRVFSEERDWVQFHDPKSLLLALVGEVGELSELMQWLPGDEIVQRAGQQPLASRLGEELADVQLYLARLADVLGVDLAEAALRKLARSRERFPAETVRGEAPLKS